jgi:hypothetical protein
MASGTQELEQFVRDALAKGASRPELQSVLDAAGWPAEQSRNALSAYADVPFVVPVPRPKPYLSAREAFLYWCCSRRCITRPGTWAACCST